jgi:hypothetical protein
MTTQEKLDILDRFIKDLDTSDKVNLELFLSLLQTYYDILDEQIGEANGGDNDGQ